MKNPLILFSIIGIVAGYIVGTMMGGVDQNSYLTYGLIGGLLVGYLVDSKSRSGSSTRRPTDTTSGQSARNLFDQMLHPQQQNPSSTQIETPQSPVQDVVEENHSKVSGVDQSVDDVIARAREEIERNTK
ncbi:MAG: ABC transporter permease [Chloroflexi bacterium]|nr:ABC transporter permease [Chloroflexota bacterium]